MITLVPVHKVDEVWPVLAAGFHEAVMATGGDITIGELWQGCRRGDYFLVVAHGEAVQGASIWTPQTWQTGQVLRCLGLFGEGMEGWIEEMHETVRKIAEDCGATALVSEGRVGWQKIFKNAKKLRILYEELI